VLVRGAPPSTSTFRQYNDLYYLSGLEVPNAYLELDTRDARSVVYLPHRNPAAERSGGVRLCAEEVDAVLALTGADEVSPLEELPAALGRRIKRRLAPVVFTPLAPAEGRGGTRDGGAPVGVAPVDVLRLRIVPEGERPFTARSRLQGGAVGLGVAAGLVAVERGPAQLRHRKGPGRGQRGRSGRNRA